VTENLPASEVEVVSAIFTEFLIAFVGRIGPWGIFERILSTITVGPQYRWKSPAYRRSSSVRVPACIAAQSFTPMIEDPSAEASMEANASLSHRRPELDVRSGLARRWVPKIAFGIFGAARNQTGHWSVSGILTRSGTNARDLAFAKDSAITETGSALLFW
jgi:hypothetical protein